MWDETEPGDHRLAGRKQRYDDLVNKEKTLLASRDKLLAAGLLGPRRLPSPTPSVVGQFLQHIILHVAQQPHGKASYVLDKAALHGFRTHSCPPARLPAFVCALMPVHMLPSHSPRTGEPDLAHGCVLLCTTYKLLACMHPLVAWACVGAMLLLLQSPAATLCGPE